MERGSYFDQSLLVRPESVPVPLPADVVPEKEKIIFVDGRAKSKYMRQEKDNIADELNRVDVELMDSISNTLLRKNDLNKENEESTSSGNDVEPSIMRSYESESLSPIRQSNEDIGIKYFAPMKTTPLESDDNITLQLLDLWNFDEKCAGFQVKLLKDNSLERRALGISKLYALHKCIFDISCLLIVTLCIHFQSLVPGIWKLLAENANSRCQRSFCRFHLPRRRRQFISFQR